MITQDQVKSLFEYKDGNLYWKNVNKYHNQLNDKKSGANHHSGYTNITINKKKYTAHRLIYLYHHGFLPEFVDHIDMNKSNNKIENLRAATRSQNQWNKPRLKKTVSNVKNVFFRKDMNKYLVKVYANKKVHYFGCFESLELAELVAIEARNKLHKEFARHS